VTWKIINRMEASRLELTWVESDVEFDEEKANSMHGFGRDLLENALPYQLDATTSLEFGKDGTRFWLSLPWRGNHRNEQ